MPIAAALPEVLSIGGSIASGVLGADAASNASKAAQQAAATGNAGLQTVQNQTTANLQPFVNQGRSEGSALEDLLGVGGDPAASKAAFDNYLNSTNYQFQLGQGEQAVETANAPAFSSSATAKALNTYAQGQAGSALAGYEGLLQTGEGQGIGAGTSLGSINTTNATQQASNDLAAAGVTANADVYGASALTNAIKGVTSGLSSAGSGSSGGGSALAGLLGGGSSPGYSTAFNQPGYSPFAAVGDI